VAGSCECGDEPSGSGATNLDSSHNIQSVLPLIQLRASELQLPRFIEGVYQYSVIGSQHVSAHLTVVKNINMAIILIYV
jgi:hypothetical protein